MGGRRTKNLLLHKIRESLIDELASIKYLFSVSVERKLAKYSG